jgi:hypothetical protein
MSADDLITNTEYYADPNLSLRGWEVGFLSISREIPGRCVKFVKVAWFPIFPNSIFINILRI